ncbi:MULTISPECIES: mechanosensitive ion channel family protein [Metabacillus]|uniref:Mechanosensitive ion channel protein MscS n=3 Tax=Metabacillus TaxID=2675233 RepID=A0A179SNT8_9BACI|nr:MULTISPECIES: mechanosensitive ion channel family protein [Metabacillus]OAS83131.1 mechanosensitive ion channel protein MscS [Metabacillus litoralis]QNF27667.1 mechanosensitive ion channel family protein [Metabacillus sp. KUDC1714]
MNTIENLWNEVLEYITDGKLWVNIGEGLLKIVLITIVSTIFIRIGKLAISKIFLFRGKSPIRISERRENTLSKLLENILTYVVYFIAIIMILEAVSINVGALLAGAGIVGLAVGFGAQSLVKDIITGFFIIFEDQFSVGDHIRVAAFEGTVEEIGLRTTKIKNWTGELHIIPNGSIVEVTNFSIHNSMAVVDVSISFETDIPEAERVIQDLLTEIPDKYEDIVTPPELLGIQTLGASEIILRVVCEVEPMRHFHIARMLRKDIKMRLDEHGIEIPYPRMVMYNRKEQVS